MINWPRMGEGGAGFEAAYRSKLAFMAGEESRCVVGLDVYGCVGITGGLITSVHSLMLS